MREAAVVGTRVGGVAITLAVSLTLSDAGASGRIAFLGMGRAAALLGFGGYHLAAVLGEDAHGGLRGLGEDGGHDAAEEEADAVAALALGRDDGGDALRFEKPLGTSRARGSSPPANLGASRG